jgi:hypothetical protein
MSSAPSTADIGKDATWLAQALDPPAGMVRLIAMSSEAYRAASFLDDRMLQQPVDAHVVAWPEVAAALSDANRNDARWIFHVGHVGSTLVSRMLGELPSVLAIREPRLLRDLAMCPAEVRAGYVGSIPKLMSRTFSSGEFACVKATSLVSEIAAELVPPRERALFMFATPRNYVASILAGENSVQELRMLGETRAERMAGRVGAFPARNDADLAAAAWACEMTSLEAAADAMPDRSIAWADFDRMLDDMPAELARAATFFGFLADDAGLRAIAAGPLMGRYSKAPEHAYSPALRGELIAEVLATHGREIDDALALLGRAAEKSLLLARALARSEGD